MTPRGTQIALWLRTDILKGVHQHQSLLGSNSTRSRGGNPIAPSVGYCLTFQTVISKEQCLPPPPPPPPGDLILGTPEGRLLAKHPRKAERDPTAELGQLEAAPLNPQPCRAHPKLAGLEKLPTEPAPGNFSLAASESTSSPCQSPRSSVSELQEKCGSQTNTPSPTTTPFLGKRTFSHFSAKTRTSSLQARGSLNSPPQTTAAVTPGGEVRWVARSPGSGASLSLQGATSEVSECPLSQCDP